MFDVKQCLNDSEKKMSQAVKHLEETLARIRAGKANVEILDEVRVESYGTMMPLNQVSHHCHKTVGQKHDASH